MRTSLFFSREYPASNRVVSGKNLDEGGLREALRRLLISQHQSAGIGLLVIFQLDLSQGKAVRV
jgi:hypothetical protein